MCRLCSYICQWLDVPGLLIVGPVSCILSVTWLAGNVKNRDTTYSCCTLIEHSASVQLLLKNSESFSLMRSTNGWFATISEFPIQMTKILAAILDDRSSEVNYNSFV